MRPREPRGENGDRYVPVPALPAWGGLGVRGGRQLVPERRAPHDLGGKRLAGHGHEVDPTPQYVDDIARLRACAPRHAPSVEAAAPAREIGAQDLAGKPEIRLEAARRQLDLSAGRPIALQPGHLPAEALRLFMQPGGAIRNIAVRGPDDLEPASREFESIPRADRRCGRRRRSHRPARRESGTTIGPAAIVRSVR